MSDFVHLHVHSHYSLLDAVSKIDELVKTAKKRGFSALALTDHGNLYGAIEFYEACKKEDIKPIIGVEAYIAPVNRFEQDPSNRYHHLVWLAVNETGYRNLIKLVSLAHLEGFYYKPRMDKELLRAHHEGLIALSACQSGEVLKNFKNGNFEGAKASALEYSEIFGPDNFYLELGDLPALSGQTELNNQVIELSKATGLPLVVTRDCHYLNPDDAEAREILTCIRDGRTIDEPDRQSLAEVDLSLATAKDIASRFKHIPEALANTVKIAERVNLELVLNKWNFADFPIPSGKTADEYLREQVYEKLPLKIAMTDEVKTRIEYELGVIFGKGYSPYFLIVADYVQYARDHDIIETTRGSAAGSIVAYSVGITTVNPLYFKLPFERFLNPFRPSAPDVDADFADDKRDEMIAYVTKKYGADKVAQIITFGTMAARGSVRDVGRALGYSYGFCDQVSKLIPFGAQGFQMTITKALDLEPDLKKKYNEDPKVRRLIDLARKIEGCARHTSIHAAGVVISPTPLTDFTPVQHETGGGRVTTQYEMHAVEAAGLLKQDFLGIRNLSILGHAVEIIKKTTGQKIDIFNIPWDDKKTYEMLAAGDTMGVFQLSSSGMTRYLKELKPETIFDIMAMVALFRPGPMESIPEYIRRKNNPEVIEYLHPKMADYLDQSLGLIVYQDDVLMTAINLAGYNWEEADKFRKAMGKKIPAEMAKQEEKFRTGCKEFGKLSPVLIEQIWERIKPFAAYGFNKAHACSYGVVAYQTAYLKANFSVQYMTAVLIAESGDMDKVPEIIAECERMGVKVKPPDVNESFKNFAMIGWENAGTAHIRFGLQGVKNVGEHIADMIFRERKANGTYKNLEDFLRRVQDRDLNKKSVESLAKCGALDCFGYDRNMIVFNIENVLAFAKQTQEQEQSKQNTLFGAAGLQMTQKVRLDPAPLATEAEKLTWEKELLGLYVTSHPFKYFEHAMGESMTRIMDLSQKERKKWVVVGGVIDSTKKKITRAGAQMMFVTIQDTTASLELLVFPRTYETTKDVWVEGRMVCVIGKTSEEEGDNKLFVEKAYELTKENVEGLSRQLVFNKTEPALRAYVPAQTLAHTQSEAYLFIENLEDRVEIKLPPAVVKNKANGIKAVLSKYPGDKMVYLLVGDKKIKTQYLVAFSDELRRELAVAIG